MKKLIIFLGVFLYVLPSFSVGNLKGTVKDIETGDPIPFANIIILQKGTQITGATTDFDGNYAINGLDDGKYDIKATYVGYQPKMIKAVIISPDMTTYQNLELKSTMEHLDVVQIVSYKVPLIRKDAFSSGATITSNGQSSLSSSDGSGSSGGYYSYKRKKNRKKSKSHSVSHSNQQPIHTTPAIANETYEEISENEFKAARSEPLSTFSLDVDVASYSNCRRFISNGQMPPKNAVRIEEFINYFTYTYTAPEGEHPFSIDSEISECPWNGKHKLLHLGIQGEKIKTNDLQPNNLVFLVDVSGSMDYDNKLPLVKKSLNLLVNELGDGDRIAIVTYASSCKIALKSISCKHKKEIIHKINSLQAGGSTAGGEGLKLAYEIANRNFKENSNNRVILCTDGDFNVGISSDSELVKFIEEKRGDGIFLSVLGYGMGNYKDSKMEKLADKGNGNYAYIDNLMEAQKVLVHEINATLHTIAKDVKIQVEFNPAYVKSYKLIGYENRMLAKEDFNDDMKDAGEVGAGKSVTALYEIELKNNKEINADKPKVDALKYQDYVIKEDAYACPDIATLKLRYKKPEGKQSILIETPIAMVETDLSLTSNNFKFAAAVAELGLLLRDSKFKETANVNQVISLAKLGQGDDDEGYRAEFIRLAQLVKSINPQLASVKH